MSGIPLYIFDLDGTISLTHHREHLIKGKTKDWDAFFEACDGDKPNVPVIEIMNRLNESSEIWIFSGRSDLVLDKTLSWLTHNTNLSPLTVRSRLIMRKQGDYTEDEKLKESWYKNMLLDHHRERLVCTFDDRDRVVKMWRRLGIPCFQVAEGDF